MAPLHHPNPPADAVISKTENLETRLDEKTNALHTVVKGIAKEADGNAQSIDADKVLLSIGRRPMSDG